MHEDELMLDVVDDVAVTMWPVYTLAYALAAFCIVLPPTEFISAGLTLDAIFRSFLERDTGEAIDFIGYHTRRISLNVLVHSMLPLCQLVHLRDSIASLSTQYGCSIFRCARLYRSLIQYPHDWAAARPATSVAVLSGGVPAADHHRRRYCALLECRRWPQSSSGSLPRQIQRE